MPQPAEVDDLVEELLRLFRAAQDEIERQLAAIVDEEQQARKLRRLRELQRTVDAEMRMLADRSARWLEASYPRVYELGAQQGAGSLGADFSWSQTSVEAVQRLAADTFSQVLAATEFVSDQAKAWIREAARRQTALSLIEGRTASQAGRQLGRELAAGHLADALGGPVGMIRYADGSLHRLDDYAEMLMRTSTAQAFNAGTLDQMRAFGVKYCEALDGVGCGLTSHDDGAAVNGRVFPIEVANAHPLAHPNCRRSWIGRPDIETADAAKRAKPSATAVQRADQAQAEADRAVMVERRAQARSARADRTPATARPSRDGRTARSARTPRSGVTPSP